ncbi:hypothetical protein [Alicyclobacillus ferrooxydans]|uniref:hypothetical protein n=1 Tax=Alicyclobacillus ferrooxydans TaxID=471514 RepID=UPI001FDF654B|nr:hypothetical protein [Alicyclobacillus ferrooxydans]
MDGIDKAIQVADTAPQQAPVVVGKARLRGDQPVDDGALAGKPMTAEQETTADALNVGPMGHNPVLTAGPVGRNPVLAVRSVAARGREVERVREHREGVTLPCPLGGILV